MSSSPQPTAPSTKRPLEDPSSPSGPTDQPDAKRPDKKTKVEEKDIDLKEDLKAEPATENGHDDVAVEPTNGKTESTETPQPIESTASAHDRAADSKSGNAAGPDESGWIHIRAVISSAEAATCIGKGGENVSQIRRMSGAKCTVSDYSRGAVERILTVSGAQDAVAKGFGLIIRTLNNEPLDATSTAQSKTYPLRLLIPHILIGSIIGKSGVRIREIQEASGARLNASDQCLPLSTERSLVILGVADAVHIATYYVAVTLVEQLTERFGGPAASAYATRHGGPAGAVPGGMQVVPYVPQPAGGQYGHPDTFRRGHAGPGGHGQAGGAHSGGYMQGGHGGPQGPQAQPLHFGGSPRNRYAGAGPHQPGPAAAPNAAYGAHAAQPAHGAMPQAMGAAVAGQPLTQQIYIPNDMVGAIIGKGGAKINEIRHLSGSVIKINEPQDNSNERLVTITGTGECNQMALYMLYSRLESEKHRV